ncbi:DUF6058 family natural product biosynthesis protein [Lysobacter claricitrinus]|uniref:DUF6058 family natural product biosynthesis protein n=1 Tax=Lysobacter claricitrinus TaxID=3367728 RepID=UPI0037DB7251
MSASAAGYLASNYRTTGQLAAACGIDAALLESLVDAGLSPRPSYRVDDGGTLVSVVFGAFAGTDAAPGAYFHPGTAAWVRRALRARRRLDIDATRRVLHRGFVRRFAAALRAIDRDIARLHDYFADDASPLQAALDARCEIAWTHLMDGTFGLCVTDCARVAGIARKEMLQELLTCRAERTVAARDRAPLIVMIDAYADAAMPFAPQEYPSSSRRRLVEDFGAIVRSTPATELAGS